MASSSLPFSSRLGRGEVLEKDAAVLMEFDPSSQYEEAVKDFADERLASGGQVLVFTSRASAVSKVLPSSGDVNLFLMSDRSSSSSSTGEVANQEVIIARYDTDIILNSLGQNLRVEPLRYRSLIFDNLSDMVLLLGVEKTYKFTRKANEMIFDSGGSSLFLLVSGAHDDRARSIIESVFRRIMIFDKSGMRTKK